MLIQNGSVQNPPFPKNYASEFLVLESGNGVYLEDTAGKKYLDFGSGIAVNSLGYGREDIVEVASRQMRKLVHVSNLFTTQPALELAEKLVASGNFTAVHFGNSGTEANEAAIKYARLYARRKRGSGHHRILSFHQAFHGRTMGALSCTPTPAYREAFEPLVPGCESVDFNDPRQLESVLDGTFAAVIVEVVQGEGGLVRMTEEFAARLNELCRKFDVILIADEVQTGLGRTGRLYASQLVGLQPDIITLAKPLAAGLPLSATLLPAKINDLLKPGDHGTTFGGGPVTTAVAQHVWNIVSNETFLSEVRERSRILAGLLFQLEGRPGVTAIRGEGLLRGVVLDTERTPEALGKVLTEARRRGLLLLRSGKNVIRIAPPLIIGEADIRKGVEILADTLSTVYGAPG